MLCACSLWVSSGCSQGYVDFSLIGLYKLHLMCKEQMRMWDCIELVWMGVDGQYGLGRLGFQAVSLNNKKKKVNGFLFVVGPILQKLHRFWKSSVERPTRNLVFFLPTDVNLPEFPISFSSMNRPIYVLVLKPFFRLYFRILLQLWRFYFQHELNFNLPIMVHFTKLILSWIHSSAHLTYNQRVVNTCFKDLGTCKNICNKDPIEKTMKSSERYLKFKQDTLKQQNCFSPKYEVWMILSKRQKS